MSSAPDEFPVTEVAVDADIPKPKKARVAKPIVIPAKIQKKIESLDAKLLKVVADNKALKQQLSEIKSANSRVRRIPKPVPAEAE
jgi:hypothetical protein